MGSLGLQWHPPFSASASKHALASVSVPHEVKDALFLPSTISTILT
jgi:hypothetical protein